MKTHFTFLTILFFFSLGNVFTQPPQSIPYQAVARDSSGNPITNQAISLRFSIHDLSPVGIVVYKETHFLNTNSLGLFTANIGEGVNVSGVFSSIDWSDGSKYLQVELDTTGGISFTDMGTQQMQSVPYALFSGNANWSKKGNNIYNSNTGNVGIGTNNPQYVTDIFVPGNTSGTGLNIHTNLAGNATGYLRFTNTINNDSSGAYSSYIGGELNSATTGHSLVFGTSNYAGIPTDKMRIQGDGNVGIGIAIPTSAKLEVAGQVKITGGSPGAGKVLTSDATGLASWESLNTSETNYSYVTMGCQKWMDKNLDVITYRNGDPIPKVTSNVAWSILTTGAYCYYNNDSATYAAIYGKLYNWYAVNDPRGLAPVGWHTPTYSEWTILVDILGGSASAGGAMKASGLTYWTAPNTMGSNISGFNGLPCGYRLTNGTFNYIGDRTYWWASSEVDATNAYSRSLEYDNGNCGGGVNGVKKFGFSVRCIMD